MNSEFNETSFWKKITKYAKKIGKPVIETALILFFCFKDKDTPLQAKAVIASALAYFALPIDLIPDFIPVVGYSDDLGALAMALATVAFYIKPEHKKAAKEKLDQWFSNDKKDEFKQQEIGQYLQILIVSFLKKKHEINVENEDQNTIISFARKRIKNLLEEYSQLKSFLEDPKTLKKCYENSVKALQKEIKKCPDLAKECPWTIEELLDGDFISD